MSLDTGFFFPQFGVDSPGVIFALPGPIDPATVSRRLTRILRRGHLDEGERLHMGFRGGCSITLRLLGMLPDEMMSEIGWASPRVAESYSHFERVMSRMNITPEQLKSMTLHEQSALYRRLNVSSCGSAASFLSVA